MTVIRFRRNNIYYIAMKVKKTVEYSPKLNRTISDDAIVHFCANFDMLKV